MGFRESSNRSWTLKARIKDAFGSTIRGRGESYYQQGWAKLSEMDELSATFSVSGTEAYTVRLNWDRAATQDAVSFYCTCPYFADGLLCKHCWAAVLVLDHHGVSSQIPGRQRLKAQLESRLRSSQAQVSSGSTRHSSSKAWLRKIKAVQLASERASQMEAAGASKGSVKTFRTAYYVLDLEKSKRLGELVVEFYQQDLLQSGLPGAIRHFRISQSDIPLYANFEDREILSLLLATNFGYAQASGRIPTSLQLELLKKLAKTGRFYLGAEALSAGLPLSFDEGAPWRLRLKVEKLKHDFEITGFLVRDQERLPLSVPQLILRSGVVIFEDRIASLNLGHDFDWIAELRENDFVSVPLKDGDELVEVLCSSPHSPAIEWPLELEWKQVKVTGLPSVSFSRELLADLRFSYSDQWVSTLDPRPTLLDKPNRRIILRDFESEKEALGQLLRLEGMNSLRVQANAFSEVVREILSWGWKVEAQGKVVRQAEDFEIKVSSGVDWFDLNADVTYPNSPPVRLPALLAALERGEYLIPLGDGTYGMLPTQWLKKYAPLTQLGEAHKEGYRFNQSRGALLAAWLSHESSAESIFRADRDFSKLKKEIDSIATLKPKSPSRTFQGKLRSYQKDGLAWLDFLQRLEFGGILADDMGLGKTIQVLAHLEAEYTSKVSRPRHPSIIFVPKSLLFNWQEEAKRFAPKLRVLVYAGQSRRTLLPEIAAHDLVLVTYPTLRLDFEEFQKFNFHYVIADEAQAIKNSESITHKACRLIRGSHRLAMTGTPVENSIDDLFSIMDFVNPSLLGSAIRSQMSRAATHEKLDTSALGQLAKSLSPFILRRTKGQVLKDLPEKVEKVIFCELSDAERRNYDELRDHYRTHLRGEIERRGIARSKIIILEALLRLRQAACHPGLVDKKRASHESTKLETLIAQIQQIVSEGHKALVFSQFTSFLDIVEAQLHKDKIAYVRLDGKTSAQERKARVEQFQTDSSLRLFLVSLKAGGVGLNLTAADYVFILDPWWNPAAESQAIDRSHRIGQKNKVIAYRLIAKNTVEEKILALQGSKRSLADAIITADTSLIRKLTLQDIEALLS
jgi:superfamily II DNA or RNA helicase